MSRRRDSELLNQAARPFELSRNPRWRFARYLPDTIPVGTDQIGPREIIARVRGAIGDSGWSPASAGEGGHLGSHGGLRSPGSRMRAVCMVGPFASVRIRHGDPRPGQHFIALRIGAGFGYPVGKRIL